MHNLPLVLGVIGVESPNQPLQFLRPQINVGDAHPLNITMQQCSRCLLQVVRLEAKVPAVLLTFPQNFYTFSMWADPPLSTHPLLTDSLC